jgi:hypothetical protein
MGSIKSGQQVRVTIQKAIKREGARKTLERLFMSDKAHAKPLAARSRGFKALPKRRGGRIWTKYATKRHLTLSQGLSATIKATPQSLRDLASVQDLVEVSPV